MRIYTKLAASMALLTVIAAAGVSRAVPVMASPISISYTDFSNTSNLKLNGDAATVGSPGSKVLRLTPNDYSKHGSAFYKTAVDTTLSFHTQFELSFHDSTSNDFGPADGTTFVIQKDTRGSSALGEAGGNLGYGGEGGIHPSIAVGFNTYFGGGKPPLSVLLNGDAFTYHAEALFPDQFPALNFYGSPRYAWIDYDGGSHLLQVFVSTTSTKPATPFLTFAYDIATQIGHTAYVGFTAGTADGNMAQDILNWQYTSTSAVTNPVVPQFVLGLVPAMNAESIDNKGFTPVTFFSPIWSHFNELWNSPPSYAPANFKGFVTSVSDTSPQCGDNWSAPVAYQSAAPKVIPTFMVVFVSTNISESNGIVSGDIIQMVVVQTSPIFNNSHGRVGTGTVVDTLCSAG